MSVRRCATAVAAATVVVAALTGCTTATPSPDPVPTQDPVPSQDPVPAELTVDLTRYTDAAAAAFDPARSVKQNVAAFTDAFTVLAEDGYQVAVAQAYPALDTPAIRVCEELALDGGQTAQLWTVYFTPDGVAQEVADGAGCGDLVAAARKTDEQEWGHRASS